MSRTHKHSPWAVEASKLPESKVDVLHTPACRRGGPCDLDRKNTLGMGHKSHCSRFIRDNDFESTKLFAHHRDGYRKISKSNKKRSAIKSSLAEN